MNGDKSVENWRAARDGGAALIKDAAVIHAAVEVIKLYGARSVAPIATRAEQLLNEEFAEYCKRRETRA